MPMVADGVADADADADASLREFRTGLQDLRGMALHEMSHRPDRGPVEAAAAKEERGVPRALVQRNSRRAPKWIRMQREREAAAEVWGSTTPKDFIIMFGVVNDRPGAFGEKVRALGAWLKTHLAPPGPGAQRPAPEKAPRGAQVGVYPE